MGGRAENPQKDRFSRSGCNKRVQQNPPAFPPKSPQKSADFRNLLVRKPQVKAVSALAVICCTLLHPTPQSTAFRHLVSRRIPRIRQTLLWWALSRPTPHKTHKFSPLSNHGKNTSF